MTALTLAAVVVAACIPCLRAVLQIAAEEREAERNARAAERAVARLLQDLDLKVIASPRSHV